jgi:ribonuclease D
MPQFPFPPATLITRQEELNQLAAQLAQEPLIGVDTESNSMYAYRERVCLIQISTRSADYLIDPLTVEYEKKQTLDMQVLAPVFASPKVEKVFHAAEYDMICLKRDYGYAVVNLFDTMIAARVCGYKLFGLANLLEEHCGVKADKSHQRDDWGRRPLDPASLSYAQVDSHYLPMLRDILYQQLVELGRLDEALESFAEACEVELPERGFDPDGYWKLGLPAELNRRSMAVLRELYIFREEVAQHRDIPPFKVLANRTLLSIARQHPTTLRELSDCEGMSPLLVRRYGESLLRAVERGKNTKLPDPPRHTPLDPQVTERYTALHQWRKDRALERGVESDVIVSKEALWEMAREAPTTLDQLRTIRGLGPWRFQTYGAELLNVLAKFINGSS